MLSNMMLHASDRRPRLHAFLGAVAELCIVSKGHLDKIQAPNDVVWVGMI